MMGRKGSFAIGAGLGLAQSAFHNYRSLEPALAGSVACGGAVLFQESFNYVSRNIFRSGTQMDIDPVPVTSGYVLGAYAGETIKHVFGVSVLRI